MFNVVNYNLLGSEAIPILHLLSHYHPHLEAPVGRRVHGEAGDVVDAVLPEAGVGAGRPQRVRDGHGGAEAAPAHVQVHVLPRVHAADGRQHPPAPLPEK